MDLKTQYQTSVNLFTSEGSILWSRYNTFLIINSIIVTLLGYTYNKSRSLPLLIGIPIPLVGMIFCYLWWKMTKKGFYWIKFWIQTAREIEEKQKDNNSLVNPITKGYKKSLETQEFFNAEVSSLIIIDFFALSYLGMLLYNLYLAVIPLYFFH